MSWSDEQLVFAFWPGGADGDPQRTDLLGGKGASLAALCRAGFPVPPGFTISARCCEYVAAHGHWPPGLEAQLQHALEQLERRVGRPYGAGPQPLLLAVRSGAAVSMPGMMDTILNCGLHSGLVAATTSPTTFWAQYAEHLRMFLASVAGVTLAPQEDELPRHHAARLLDEWERRTGQPLPDDVGQRLRLAIDAVLASWNSERATTYRRHHAIRHVTGTAVNVQSMFPSQRSGVLFTANPQAPRAGEMVLEASWGLGEAVVSGAVTPDVYVLDAASLRILRTQPGQRPHDEPALSEGQIVTLGELGRSVAEHFGHPCDIEWGWADGQPALLQARAIKGLELAADLQDARSEERLRLQSLANEAPTVWVLHNLAETLPAPTPLTADLMRWFLSARGGFGQLYRILGFTPLDTPHSLLEIIGGRPYLDPRRAAELFFGDLPLGYDLDRLAVDAQLLDGPPQRIEWERASAWFFLRVPRLLAIVWRAARREQQLASSAVMRFQQHVVQAVDQFLAETRDKKLTQLDDEQLAAEWQRRRDWVLGELAAESLLPGYLGGLAFARLRESLMRIAGPVEGALWSTRLTAGLPGDVTVEQNDWLWQVAQGQRSLDEFLTRFGHRAAGEMELAVPRWRDDPSYLTRIVDQWRNQPGEAPAARHAAQEAAREAAEREWMSELARYGASSLREDLWVDLRRAQQLLPYREAGKFQLLRAYATLRDVACEWGRRWQLGDDVFYLAEQDLVTGRPVRESCADQVRRRRLRWQSCQKLGFPERIDSRRLEELDHGPAPLPQADAPQADAPQGTLTARPLSAGIVEGTARHVLDPRDGTALPDDCILICPSTDPGWTPLFVRIRGLIVERGGALSHGAIVARDFGIPAVACERALARIPDGARIRLDAERGEVRIMGATP